MDSAGLCPQNKRCTYTGWRRPIGCLKLQVIFRKRATTYRALLRGMTSKDKASYGFLLPFTWLLCGKGTRKEEQTYMYMCLYIYVCIYVCEYIHIRDPQGKMSSDVCMCICTRIYFYEYKYIQTRDLQTCKVRCPMVYVYVCICTCTYSYICMYMYIYIYIYRYVCIYTCERLVG